MRRALGLLAICAACSGNLDTPDQVHDLRLLSIRAEPPEEVLPLQLLPDGGALVGPGFQLLPVTLTGLVADPDGGGREVSYTFSTCAALDSTDSRCHSDEAGYQVLGQGTVVAGELGAEPSVTWTPDVPSLIAAAQADPFHGFGGLRVPVQLDISAGSEATTGIKRMVFTAGGLGPLPPANNNPALADLTAGTEAWAAAGLVADLLGSVAKVARLDGGSGTTVTPVPDPPLIETYTVPLLEGGTETLTEQWRYFFYTTAGTFSPDNTGGGGLFGDDAGVSSTWNPKAGEADGPASVWIVITDGRGGENWVSRRAVVTVTP